MLIRLAATLDVADVHRVLLESVAAIIHLLVFEVIVLVVLRVEVILRAAIKGSSVAVLRDNGAVVLGHSSGSEALPNLQLCLQRFASMSGHHLLWVFFHALHGGVHLLIGYRHAQAACSAPVVSAVVLGGVRNLLDGVLDDSLHGHGVDHEAEVDVALDA